MVKVDSNKEPINKSKLKYYLLENIDSFLHELGDGFCYVGNEYKIKLGNTYNYIDILFLNIKFNCYTVVELKVTELKEEHIGQIMTYMKYIDEFVKL